MLGQSIICSVTASPKLIFIGGFRPNSLSYLVFQEILQRSQRVLYFGGIAKGMRACILKSLRRIVQGTMEIGLDN